MWQRQVRRLERHGDLHGGALFGLAAQREHATQGLDPVGESDQPGAGAGVSAPTAVSLTRTCRRPSLISRSTSTLEA